MWMKNTRFQRLGGGSLETIGLRLWSRLQFTALRGRKDPHIVGLLREIHDEKRSLLSAFEAFIVYSLARSLRTRPGDFAEVGVFKGASAKLISEAKGDKRLRLFDTFEGLPPSSLKDKGVHRVSQYACSLDSVQEYLRGYDNLLFHKGIFPESTRDVRIFAEWPTGVSRRRRDWFPKFFSHHGPELRTWTQFHSLHDRVPSAVHPRVSLMARLRTYRRR